MVNRPPPIVAVGASAGGLEALERFFGAIPEKSGIAFVVIQHLSPDFKSVMDDLLARRTRIPILQAAEGDTIEGNTIYLNPPKTELRIVDGVFLSKTQEDLRQFSLPIDIFMTSIAEQLGPRATAVILSGTGSDGSKGAARIKAAGGRVYAQSAETAKFDGMPRAAIAAGVVDFVGTAAEIAAVVVNGRGPIETKPAVDVPQLDASPLAELFDIMRKATGLDFELYKQGTVLRRLERRMKMNGFEDLGEYVDLVRAKAAERDALLRDLLIEVTVFFRDPEAFEALQERIVPLVRQASEPIRVWVPGCATGEEAYSWAILLMEASEGLTPELGFKVFATDIHRSSLEHASVGRYTPEAVEHVPADLRDKYFDEHQGAFQVRPELRSHVVFAEHNLLKDPPFTRVDAVSCRNVLIYLEPAAQEEVLARFLFAIKARGVLFLGPSETVGKLDSGLEVEDRHWRIFRKLSESRLASGVPLPRPMSMDGRGAEPRRQARAVGSRIPIRRLAYDQLLERYVPTGFLVNAQGQLLHTFGEAGRFLDLTGPATSDLASMLVVDLRVAVSAALRRAVREGKPVAYGGVLTQTANQPPVKLSLTVEPLADEENTGTFFVRLDRPGTPVEVPPAETYSADELVQRHVNDLETQLHETRETLQVTVEELETSNEELQATNEELLASNEELQSTNEELQSVNEELYTVNAEYEKRNHELLEANRDLGNLMDSTDIGTIFLDEALCIRKFTPAIMGAFRLREQDIGRPLTDLASTLTDDENLAEDAKTVLETGHSLEREVDSTDGRHFLQRITPYRGERATVEGVVLSYVDLTTEWQVRKEMARVQALQRSVLESLSANVAVLDPDGKIIAVNSSWSDFASDNGPVRRDTIGTGANYFAACVGVSGGEDHTDAQRALAGIRDVLLGRVERFEMQYPCHAPSKRRWFQMNVTPVGLDQEEARGAVVMHLDITESRSVRSELEHLLTAVSHAEIGFYVADSEGVIEAVNDAFIKMSGYEEQDVIGEKAHILRSGAHSRAFYQSFWRTITSGKVWSGQFINRRRDGREYVAETTVSPVLDEGGTPISYIAFARDVTETQRLNERIRRAQKLETVGQLAGGVAHDFNNLLTPIIGYAEMLLEEQDDSNREFAQPILEAATMAQDLTSQLLTFSRKQPVKLTDFDLNDLVSGFSGMVRRLIRESIEIKYELRRTPLPVEADRAQIEQVLLNLTVNAQDAMPNGGNLTIGTSRAEVDRKGTTLHPDLDAGQYALLTVQDDGEGISSEVVDRLFEPFFTTKEAGKGTGLGLATAYGVARRHGGVILVKSAVGEGSTFTLCLPLDRAEDAKHPAAPLPPAELGSGEHVLVVEDDPRVRKLAVRLLRSGGYEVTAFEKPQEALDRLADREMPVSLVLSDVVMPEMSGPEMVHLLRDQEITVPVLFMSGYPGDVVRKDDDLNEAELVPKPFTKQSLLHAVRRALDRAVLGQ